MTIATDYPGITYGAVIALNWPVYGFVWRQIFIDRADAKRSFVAYLKPALFWNWESSEPRSAAKVMAFILAITVILGFEFALLNAVLSKI